jgi:mannose-6-phosphate isomerase-like protein (cupin superfamily)
MELHAKLSNLVPELNAHGSGTKLVFRKNTELNNSCTQIAFGEFKPGESCELHAHKTMYEYFYFIEGRCLYEINDTQYLIEPDTFVEIPPNYKHRLINNGDVYLKFIYWGIAID